MRKLVPIAAALLLAVLPAGSVLAACYNLPDDARSHYVENGTRQMLCLQDELNAATQAQANDVQIQQQLAQLQQQIQQQQTRLQQSIAVGQPSLPGLLP